MYDIHVGDCFANVEEGEDGFKSVTVIETFPLDNNVKIEYDESGAHRVFDREEFLEKYPIVIHN